jgi:hypothetical protein
MPFHKFKIAGLITGASLLGLAGPAGAVDSIRPGYWSTTNTVTSPIHQTKTEDRCITRKAIQKFAGCYINHHYKCSCPQQSNTDGRIVFRGDCVDAKGRHVLIDGEGSYTATTLQMSARGDYKMMGLSIPFSTHTDSHWVADTCPAGSPGSDGR